MLSFLLDDFEIAGMETLLHFFQERKKSAEDFHERKKSAVVLWERFCELRSHFWKREMMSVLMLWSLLFSKSAGESTAHL